jgi:hypothetical protein
MSINTNNMENYEMYDYDNEDYYILKQPRVKYVKGVACKSGRTIRLAVIKKIEKSIDDQDIETTSRKYSDVTKNQIINTQFCGVCRSHLCYDAIERKNIKAKNRFDINMNMHQMHYMIEPVMNP